MGAIDNMRDIQRHERKTRITRTVSEVPGVRPTDESTDFVASCNESFRRIVRWTHSAVMTAALRPSTDRTREWLAHAAPIMVCTCHGEGRTSHHWPTGMCSDGWLAERRGR